MKAGRLRRLHNAALRFVVTLESVEQRCLAYDGPVGHWKEEVRDEEMRRLYWSAQEIVKETAAPAARRKRWTGIPRS